jgi:hypothetical protein
MRYRTSLEQSMSKQIRPSLIFTRFLFIVGIALTVAGGALEGSDTVSDALAGIKIAKAGYIVVLIFVGSLFAMQAYFWTQRSSLTTTSRIVRRPPSVCFLQN